MQTPKAWKKPDTGGIFDIGKLNFDPFLKVALADARRLVSELMENRPQFQVSLYDTVLSKARREQQRD